MNSSSPSVASPAPASGAEHKAPMFPRLPARSHWQIFQTSVWAFMLRELKSKYLTTRLGLVWAIADPAVILLIFVGIHSLMGDPGAVIAGASSVEFFFWGVLPFFMYSHAANATNGAVRASQGLLSYRQIQPLDIIVARVIIEWGVMMIVAALAIFVWWIAGNQLELDNPLGILVYLVALAVLGMSYGIFAEVVGTVVPDMRRILAQLMRPMLFISGLFFTMDMIPWGAEKYLVWNPVLHLVDLTRGSALMGYDSPGNFGYAMLWAMGLLLLGLAIYRQYRDQFQ